MLTKEQFLESVANIAELDEKAKEKAYLKYLESEGREWQERSFTILGSPKAWQRHRASRFSGMYDPNTSDKAVLVSQFSDEFGKDFPMIQGEVILEIKSYKPIPKSMPKSTAALYEAGLMQPISKPDVDNYIKLIQDAINGVIYNDDAQIIKIVSEKYLSFRPRVEIKLLWRERAFK